MQDLARCSLLERRRSSDIGSSKRLPVNCWRLEEHLPKEQALLLSQILGPMMEAWTVTVDLILPMMISQDSTSVAGRSCAQMHCASSCCCIAGAAKERALHRSKEKSASHAAQRKTVEVYRVCRSFLSSCSASGRRKRIDWQGDLVGRERAQPKLCGSQVQCLW